ncbi:MAG: ATP-binding protein [Thermodesulfobacteriota bacterium]
MFSLIRKSFGNKIMAVVIISISVVMTAEILLRIYFGTRDRISLVTALNRDVAASTYAGIRYPMSVGDSESVIKVLRDVRSKMQDVQVYMCDFDSRVVWSTHETRVQQPLAGILASTEALEALRQALLTGTSPERSFQEETADGLFLITIQSIANQGDCFHCHGSKRAVVGGLVIRTDVRQAYRAVSDARNRTIVISVIGISITIFLIYTMVVKFVQRPVQQLAEQARRFADGDMSVSVSINTQDEIGVLGSLFNDMVKRIGEFSRELEAEIAKKSVLLRERATLIFQLRRANTRLTELNQIKSNFLANMSHELRTPMNSIIGFTDLLLDEVDGKINAEQRRSLEKVSANASHLLRLINDILDLSKIEAGRITLEPERFSISSLISSIMPLFEVRIREKNLQYSVAVDQEADLVYADPEKVKYILINLITNAIKFTQAGGIDVVVRTSRRGVAPGQPPLFVEVSVVDTGIGIEEEHITRIFNKFVQADPSAAKGAEGTGLGLAIARSLVALHKGVIWVDSEPGKGSRFHFTIPLREEVLEHPEQPVLELTVAEELSRLFETPCEVFLEEPRSLGKPTHCWEYMHCGEVSCPAYGSKESRCWLILGTHCAGMRVGAYPEKVVCCQGCEVLQQFVLQRENLTDTLSAPAPTLAEAEPQDSSAGPDTGEPGS